MRFRKYATLVIVAMTIGALLPFDADAGGRRHGSKHGYHHGHHHGHHYGSSVSIGFGFLFAPYFYGYPYYAPAPVYVVPAQRPPARVVSSNRSYSTAREKLEYCREYTKKILVDGREEQAYGTACLQDDGSWRIMN